MQTVLIFKQPVDFPIIEIVELEAELVAILQYEHNEKSFGNKKNYSISIY
jgi:hypothetical protein